MLESDANLPAATAFATWMGASAGRNDYANELIVADIDRDLVRRWVERGEERADGVELVFRKGSYPDELIPTIIKMFDGAANDESVKRKALAAA